MFFALSVPFPNHLLETSCVLQCVVNFAIDWVLLLGTGCMKCLTVNIYKRTHSVCCFELGLLNM
jgi:hypothetical protein